MADSLVGVRNLLMKIASETQSPKAILPQAAKIGQFFGTIRSFQQRVLVQSNGGFWFSHSNRSMGADAIRDFGVPLAGIKQGCPLAMLLYIIYIEPLLLRFKKELMGVKITGLPLVVGGHVDDQFLLVKCDEDIRCMWVIVESFEDYTNALINRQKTR